MIGIKNPMTPTPRSKSPIMSRGLPIKSPSIRPRPGLELCFAFPWSAIFTTCVENVFILLSSMRRSALNHSKCLNCRNSYS
jgi:hypothetical protein